MPGNEMSPAMAAGYNGFLREGKERSNNPFVRGTQDHKQWDAGLCQGWRQHFGKGAGDYLEFWYSTHEEASANRFKMGFRHMLEMRELEDELRREGVSDTVKLHFGAVARYETRHRCDPSYSERQAIARARGETWAAPAAPSDVSDADVMRLALEQIRDGHNDPRALARYVLDGGNTVPHTDKPTAIERDHGA